MRNHRVLPAILLTILATARFGRGTARKRPAPEFRPALRVRLRQLEHPGHVKLPAQEGRTGHHLHGRSVLPGRAPEGYLDVGRGRGTRQQLQNGRRPRNPAIREFRQASDGPTGRHRICPGRHRVPVVLALSLGPCWERERVCEGHLAGANARTRRHVLGSSVSTHRAGQLQRAQEQHDRDRHEG